MCVHICGMSHKWMCLYVHMHVSYSHVYLHVGVDLFVWMCVMCVLYLLCMWLCWYSYLCVPMLKPAIDFQYISVSLSLYFEMIYLTEPEALCSSWIVQWSSTGMPLYSHQGSCWGLDVNLHGMHSKYCSHWAPHTAFESCIRGTNKL